MSQRPNHENRTDLYAKAIDTSETPRKNLFNRVTGQIERLPAWHLLPAAHTDYDSYIAHHDAHEDHNFNHFNDGLYDDCLTCANRRYAAPTDEEMAEGYLKPGDRTTIHRDIPADHPNKDELEMQNREADATLEKMNGK